ncbi:MAG: indole-3-glycerol phosphate synthase [Chloroflexi bacterium]|nr:indole-3-glycerol phosphate synthase [Chloroflexota bacterium]|tara:strand:+ start:24495 stop:25286 length:792 start_codon:yes stop_codon:yes gene_type:complete
MTNILDDIVSHKLKEIELSKEKYSLDYLHEMIKKRKSALNLAGSLMGNFVRVIAEVKQHSPSKGLLIENFNPLKLAEIYHNNGAAAISVLTDQKYFKGTLNDMLLVSEYVNEFSLPIIRKDFILDPYQVYEARAYGADAILLIVSILDINELTDLLNLAKKFWMQCVVEVHNENELDIALRAGAEIIGINNRDLTSFATDISTTFQLAKLIPENKIIISESGIKTKDDITKLKSVGVNAVLVGESLVTSKNPANKLRELSCQE